MYSVLGDCPGLPFPSDEHYLAACRHSTFLTRPVRILVRDSPNLQSLHFRGIHVSRPMEGGTRWNSKRRLPLPSGRTMPAKKFESRDVAVTRIWSVLGKVARKPKAGRKKATSGRKQSKASKAGATVRDEAVKLLSPEGLALSRHSKLPGTSLGAAFP